MAALSDMELGFGKTSSDNPIQWIVSSRPVVAQFENEGAQGLGHLGLPFSHNGETDVLVLWIGFRVDTRELLVTLTIRLNLNPERHTRKGIPRKGRLMFMMVPVESLTILHSNVAYHELVKDPMLGPLLDLPGDSESATCRISKIEVDPITKSFVIMPEEKVISHQSRQSPQALNLLDRLKSLSEVTNFCLFTNHDPTFQQAIEHIQKELQQDNPPVTTPKFECRAFYPGRRRAAIDLWAHQGWNPRNEGSDRQEKESNDEVLPCTNLPTKRKATDVVDDGDAGPPASSPPPEYAACAFLVPSASNPCLPYLLNERDRAPNPSDTRNNSNRNGAFSAAVSAHGRFFASMPLPTPPPPSSPLSPNYSAELLSEDFSHGSKVPTPAKFATSVQVARSSSLPAVRPVGAISPYSIVAATPCKRRLTTPCAGSSNVKTTAPLSRPLHFGDVHRRNMLYLMQAGAYVSPTVADETSHHSIVAPSSPCEPHDTASRSVHHPSIHVLSAGDGDELPDLETRLTQWIIQAWSICPDMHYLYIEGLLALGQEVSRNSTQAFDDRRIALTCSLLRHRAEQNSTKDVTIEVGTPLYEHKVTAILPRMISWLYTLEPQESLTAFVDLLGLSQIEQRMLSSKDDSTGDYKEYMREWASIVSRACVLASERGVRSDVGMRMRQETGRLI